MIAKKILKELKFILKESRKQGLNEKNNQKEL